jgi:AraC-like DNA-binding protein
MIETMVFQSGELPAAERFEAYCAMPHWSPSPLEFHSDHAADFQATLRLLNFDGAYMFPVSFPSLQVRRTPKLIRQSDAEEYQIGFLRHGGAGISQAGRDVTLAAGELVLIDSWHPYELRMSSGGQDMTSMVGIGFPRALLPLPPAALDQLTARRISGGEGVGALLVGFITRLITDSGGYLPSDAPRLGSVILDLIIALLAHESETDVSVPPESRQRALMLRISAFIQQNLHDPALTPDTIAAAHHISTSYLYRLFQHENRTVVAWIRSRRLERARHDLANPALRSTPIQVIAARWGFSHPADFSRAFRAAYGIPPRDYRHTALHTP